MPPYNPNSKTGPRLVVSNPRPQIHDQLLQAINARRQISFIYQDKPRIAEPHDYGMQNGQARLLSYQIGGQSGSGRLPNWRMFDVNKMSDFKMLDETFPGNRPAKQHYQWDKLFIRVGEPE
jgi:predicted DNA-binding transcriptional regulator YafY